MCCQYTFILTFATHTQSLWTRNRVGGFHALSTCSGASLLNTWLPTQIFSVVSQPFSPSSHSPVLCTFLLTGLILMSTFQAMSSLMITLSHSLSLCSSFVSQSLALFSFSMFFKGIKKFSPLTSSAHLIHHPFISSYPSQIILLSSVSDCPSF